MVCVPFTGKPKLSIRQRCRPVRCVVFFRLGGERCQPTDIARRAGPPKVFDDKNACFFGVSNDPADESENRLRNIIPGIRFLWDFDEKVSQAFGAISKQSDKSVERRYQPLTYVLDERLRVLAILPFGPDPDLHVRRLVDFLRSRPDLSSPAANSVLVHQFWRCREFLNQSFVER